MRKVVLMDYMGTAAKEGGPEMTEMVRIICKNSRIHDPRQVVDYIWGTRKTMEEASFLDSYRTEDEISTQLIEDMKRDLDLKASTEELMTLVRGFWVNAPLFPDTLAFFEQCPLPIYLVTNNGRKYMEQALEKNGLPCAGFTSADDARAYKPHQELFAACLRLAGCAPEEAVHIGDSYRSDVLGAQAAGIQPILLLRGKENASGFSPAAQDLTEALAWVKKL